MTQGNVSGLPHRHLETTAALRWTRRDWAALLLLALLTALFFWRILTPNIADRASFPPGDFSDQFWAFSTFEVRELSVGRLPLWSPYTYAGAPFWADIQSAVLYPLSLLTLVLSGPWGFSLFALEVEAILHFWLAGAFTYLFVRRLTRHRGAALLAAITFTFAGYLTGYPSQQLAVLETAIWLPLLLYFTDRALLDRSGETTQIRLSFPDTLAAGLVLGIALLAGHPQTAMFVLYTFVLYVMFIALIYRKQLASGLLTPYHPPKGAYGLFLTPLFIILIGLGVSAIAWLPGLEYMRLSVRAAGFYEKMSGGFPLHDPIQILLPGTVSFYSPLYMGVLPLLLALSAILALRQREIIFWGALAAVAFLLSFGGETFLYTPLYLLAPGFSIFRNQERAAFIFSFSMAVLAGYGFKYQLSNLHVSKSANRQSPSAGFRRYVGWLLIGAIGMVVLFFYGLNNTGWQDDSPFNFLLSRSIWLAILLALTWGATWIGGWRLAEKSRSTSYSPLPASPQRGLIGYSLLAASFLLIAILDLFTANWKTNIFPSLPETQTAVPAAVHAMQEDASPNDIFRVYNEFRIYENYGMPYEMEDGWGASPLRLARYDEMYRSLRMERLWELLNVKYVITWREELYAPSEIIYREPTGGDVTYVHRLHQVAPRAWLVYRVQETNEEATLAQLDAFEFDPTQLALLPPETSLSLETPQGDENGQIEIVSRTPNFLALNVTTPTDGLLVLSEIYYPGWRATVDGLTTPIMRVDYALRGIQVRAGQNRVEVAYQPVTFILGALISVMTLCILIALGIWSWVRLRNSRADKHRPGLEN